MRREEFSFLSNSMFFVGWGGSPLLQQKETPFAFIPLNEIISRRPQHRLTLCGVAAGMSTRIAEHVTCPVRQSTRRSMKIKGRERGRLRSFATDFCLSVLITASGPLSAQGMVT